MTPQEYMEWWASLPDDYAELPEPVRTLVLHVEALQYRLLGGLHVDRIAQAFIAEGIRRRSSYANARLIMSDLFCACAFDHPEDVCMSHPTKAEATP